MNIEDWNMCGRKKSYETKKKANKIGNKLGHRSYECPRCFCWHLTKKIKSEGGMV